MAITRLSPLARKPYKFKPFRVRDPATPAGILNIVATATSTAATIVVPTSVVAGDVLVLGDRAENSAAVTPTTVLATGFTSINNVSDITTRQIVSYKLADGSEAGTTLTGMDGTSTDRKVLYVIRGRPVITTVSVQDVDGVISNGDPAAQTITSGSGTTPLAVFGVFGTASGSAASNTFVPGPPNQTLSASTNFRMSVKLMDIFSYNVVVDKGSDDVSDALQSFYLQFGSSIANNGSLAVTEDNDTIASTATLEIRATLAQTEAADTLSSTSTLAINATLARTEANDTLVSTAVLPISSTLTVTEANDTLTSSGGVELLATLAVTEEGDSLSSTFTLVGWGEEPGVDGNWVEESGNSGVWIEASPLPISSWAEQNTVVNSWTEQPVNPNTWVEEDELS